jgi:type VI secretion system protein ImpH
VTRSEAASPGLLSEAGKRAAGDRPGPDRPRPTPFAWSARDHLAGTPGRFDLDQAVRVGAPGGDPLALRYRTVARLGFPAGEVLGFRPDRRELVVASFGLIGAGGVLPRHHTAAVASELRKRSDALHHFVDMLAGRLTGSFVLAGAKYRPTVDPAPAERVLAAAAGVETPGMIGRSGVPRDNLLFHAGNLASRSRAATRLAAMLEEETGCPVRLEEFAGRWVRLPRSERTRLGGGGSGPAAEGQHASLGRGALIGVETWDAQSRFVVRLGPVARPEFEALLPGQAMHARVVALTRLFVGLDTGFVLAPTLEAAAIGPLQLGPSGGRLGWSSWTSLPVGKTRHGPGTEPCFEPR